MTNVSDKTNCIPVSILVTADKNNIVLGISTHLHQKVSMIRKYQNYKLQTTPWHSEEEPHNNHETPGRQTKQINQHSLPHQDHCKTRMDTKQRITKHRTTKKSHNGSNNQQRINNNITTALERTANKATGGGGLICILLLPNLRPRLCCC